MLCGAIASNPNIAVIEMLLEKYDTDMATCNRVRYTRTQKGQSILQQAVQSNANPEVLEFILGKIPEVNTKANDGSTPLHAAARHRDARVVELLLRYGGDMQAYTTVAEYPVDLAEQNPALADSEITRHLASGCACR